MNAKPGSVRLGLFLFSSLKKTVSVSAIWLIVPWQKDRSRQLSVRICVGLSVFFCGEIHVLKFVVEKDVEKDNVSH